MILSCHDEVFVRLRSQCPATLVWDLLDELVFQLVQESWTAEKPPKLRGKQLKTKADLILPKRMFQNNRVNK